MPRGKLEQPASLVSATNDFPAFDSWHGTLRALCSQSSSSPALPVAPTGRGAGCGRKACHGSEHAPRMIKGH